ncbi:uncharacterized protein LOC143888017 [Tasmannia lanceolata]|uniref:uncharacterized protein LOC143888017 n=1 Tax=Tasmannia lanceolata TaxID=3420 RepID=UPI0040635562
MSIWVGILETWLNWNLARSKHDFVLYFEANQSAFMNSESTKIPFLTGDNFSEWKDRVMLTLGWMDLDLALRVDEPSTPTDESTQDEMDHYKETSLLKTTIAKEFLEAVQEMFVTSDKALAATVMSKLVSLKHTADKGVREHIMEMRNVAVQLQALSRSWYSLS